MLCVEPDQNQYFHLSLLEVDSAEVWHPCSKLDGKTGQCWPPVMDRHRPLFTRPFDGEIEHFHQSRFQSQDVDLVFLSASWSYAFKKADVVVSFDL